MPGIAKHRIRSFFFFYACCLAVEAASSYFTRLSVTGWYLTLTKSPLTPPGIVFGIVWTVLYLLMALAAEHVYYRTKTLHCHAMRWWVIQLLLGLIWCIVFFGQRHIVSGLQVILAAWLATLLTTYLFMRVNRTAGMLMLPLLLWLGFATYLNLFIVLHN